MQFLEAIAERRIREAQERGEFDGLPGAGAPLQLEDDALVAQELRAAYRMLRNAGFVPPEIEPHRELRQIEQLMARIDSEREQSTLLARINRLLSRISSRPGCRTLRVEEAYFDSVSTKLARARHHRKS